MPIPYGNCVYPFSHGCDKAADRCSLGGESVTKATLVEKTWQWDSWSHAVYSNRSLGCGWVTSWWFREIRSLGWTGARLWFSRFSLALSVLQLECPHCYKTSQTMQISTSESKFPKPWGSRGHFRSKLWQAHLQLLVISSYWHFIIFYVVFKIVSPGWLAGQELLTMSIRLASN